MQKTKIPIFFASDDNYLPYLAVTLRSIEEYASDEYIYDINILTTGISEKNASELAKLDTPHLDIKTVNLEDCISKIRERIKKRLRDYYSESIFYRVFIPSLFPELKRAIYLDCDIVLTDDIAKLYFTDIGDNILGAVRDECIAPIPEFKEYVDKVVGAPEGIYFNSGVLLINAERFRAEKIEKKLLHLINKYNFPTVAPDQDYLNYLCRGKVHYFEHGWNKQPSGAEFAECDIHLLHFNMFNKPWHYSGVKYEEKFWQIAEKTPFAEWLKKEKARYTDDERAADMASAKKLIAATVEILEEKTSFKDVIPDGYFEEVKL